MPIANEANSGGRHPAVLPSDVPDQEERRVASDGNSYTFQQLLDYFITTAAGSSGYASPVQEGGRMTGDISVDAHHAGHAFIDTTLALMS